MKLGLGIASNFLETVQAPGDIGHGEFFYFSFFIIKI